MSVQLTIALDTCLRRNEQVFASNIGDQTVILSEETGQYYSLDPVGSAVWASLEEPCSVAHLVKKLTDLYSVDAEQCLADSQPFIQQLISNDLIQICES